MRHRHLALLGLTFALVATPVAGALWTYESDRILRSEHGITTVVGVHAGVTMISPTSRGGTWLTATDGVWYLSPQGDARGHLQVPDWRAGEPLTTAVDPYDESIWIATGGALLLHFSSDGALVHGTSLSEIPAVVAVAADQTLWLAAANELVQFAPNGNVAAKVPLRLGIDERPAALSVDSIRAEALLATNRRMLRLSLSSAASEPEVLLEGEATALALDPASGTLMAIADGQLVRIADGRVQAFEAGGAFESGDSPFALIHDGSDSTFIIRSLLASVRVANDGRVTERVAAAPNSIVAATAFRIEPSIELVRPPNGGATSNPRTDIVLRVTARCNGSICESPRRYLANVRVTATLDGLSLGPPHLDASTGNATFPARPPMSPGVNRLAARVIDAFGHEAILDRGLITLLPSPNPQTASLYEDAATSGASETPGVKAANKPPVVSLASPLSGEVFTSGTPIALTATATDADGSIAKIEFYRGGSTLIGTATTSPFRYVWTGAAVGPYSLTAKAFDNRNGTAVSAAVAISVIANQPPSVTLTAPSSGTFVAAGGAIALSAVASDPDGTIASVAFLDAGSTLGATSSRPYEFIWNATRPGVHSITARATDDKGGSTESAPVDIVVGQPPRVVVTSPPPCSSLSGPIDVALSADAVGNGGTVASVEFFDNGTSLGMVTAAPWRMTLVNAAVGTHSLIAKASDDHGLSTMSRASTFEVRGANQPPAVSITSPSEGTRFASGQTVNLLATASDADGAIAAVEFRIGSASGTLIDRRTSPPFSAIWVNPPPGSYAMVAVAYDDRNAATTSAPVNIVVNANAIPAVALTSPSPNAVYTAPATISISASASDSDGSISKVDFYSGTSLLGSSVAAPFQLTWNGIAAGSYSLTAKATDNAGATAVSSEVVVTVTNNAPPVVSVASPAPGSQFFAPATLTLSANATDSDGSISRVEFRANGIAIGTADHAPYSIVWDGAAAGNYAITALATDNAGVTATSAAVNISVLGAANVRIDAALDGSTVDDDNVLVRGVVSAPANAAMTVNGIVTHIDDAGRFQANDVPLVPGANVVTAVVTTQDGQTSSQTITVNSSGPGAFSVDASPTEGLDSLQVTFTVENPSNIAFRHVDLDLDSDGVPNISATPAQFVDGTLTVTATYPAGTWLATTRFYDDRDRVIYSTSKSIVVLLPTVLQGNLRAIYDGMLSRLRAGNIAGAMTAFTGAAYDKYNAIFNQLQPTLATVVDQLGEVREINFGMDLAEFSLVRDTSEGPQRFLIYLIRAEDGIWRIDGM